MRPSRPCRSASWLISVGPRKEDVDGNREVVASSYVGIDIDAGGSYKLFSETIVELGDLRPWGGTRGEILPCTHSLVKVIQEIRYIE